MFYLREINQFGLWGLCRNQSKFVRSQCTSESLGSVTWTCLYENCVVSKVFAFAPLKWKDKSLPPSSKWTDLLNGRGVTFIQQGRTIIYLLQGHHHSTTKEYYHPTMWEGTIIWYHMTLMSMLYNWHCQWIHWMQNEWCINYGLFKDDCYHTWLHSAMVSSLAFNYRYPWIESFSLHSFYFIIKCNEFTYNSVWKNSIVLKQKL